MLIDAYSGIIYVLLDQYSVCVCVYACACVKFVLVSLPIAVNKSSR